MIVDDRIERLVAASRALGKLVGAMRFGAPVAFVYNPLEYAWHQHEQYLRRAAAHRPAVVMLGMNPGPFGMAQTGVPFGDAPTARGWLGIDGTVGHPSAEHPKRPVLGLACPRTEVSGRRLWGWARERFGTPDRFFERFFVANYCPLVFVEAEGRNRTPDKLPVIERTLLEATCDDALRQSVSLLEPEWVIGIGAYARRAAERALGELGLRFGTVPHPSPANPRSNRGWAAQADEALAALGLEIPAPTGSETTPSSPEAREPAAAKTAARDRRSRPRASR